MGVDGGGRRGERGECCGRLAKTDGLVKTEWVINFVIG